METHLQSAYFHYRSWCRQKKLSAASLPFTLNRFGKEKWAALPELSTQYKASSVKVMMFWIADYLYENMNEAASPGRERRMMGSYMLAKFQHMLDINGPWLTMGDAKLTCEYGWSFLLFYQQLAINSRLRIDGRQNYKVTPKFHCFLHMLLVIQRTGRNARLLGRYVPV